MAWVIIAAVLILGLYAAGRVLRRRPDKVPRQHSPEYYESIEHLERLKSGRLWGDIAQPDPDN